MLKSFTFVNYIGDEITLDMCHPNESGLAIRKVGGLGPVKADVNYSEIATMDGASFNSARAGVRNITLDLVLLEKPDIETTRQLLYKHFPIKRPVKIFITTSNREVETVGYVESNEPDIFSSMESAFISIVCPNSYFKKSSRLDNGGESITSFSSIEGGFEFVFSDNNTPSLKFGRLNDFAKKNIFNDGDNPTGFEIIINATGPADGVSVYNMMTNEQFVIDSSKIQSITGTGITSGDEIRISTIIGEKKVVLLREGNEYNILNAIGKNSTWLELQKGDNLIAYQATSGAENVKARIVFSTFYEGV